MSEDEMRHKMDFIINQQAQFAADIGTLHESQRRLTDALTGLVGMFGKLMQAQEQTNAQVAELAAAQQRTDAQLAETNAQLAETNERLSVFINVVERYISRNGRTPDNNSGESAPST